MKIEKFHKQMNKRLGVSKILNQDKKKIVKNCVLNKPKVACWLVHMYILETLSKMLYCEKSKDWNKKWKI